MNDQTIALNTAQCLHRSMHAGFTRVHNVCTGSVTDVPWGFFDWAIGGTLLCVFLGLAFMCIGLTATMLRGI